MDPRFCFLLRRHHGATRTEIIQGAGGRGGSVGWQCLQGAGMAECTCSIGAFTRVPPRQNALSPIRNPVAPATPAPMPTLSAWHVHAYLDKLHVPGNTLQRERPELRAADAG
jgi:hypothetical protein